MTIQYTLVGTEDGSNLSVFVPGHAPQVAHSSHSQFQAILDGVLAGDESVIDLFDAARAAAARFEPLSERVSTRNGKLYLDGEEVHNVLADEVVRFLSEGVDDWYPLVRFFENVQANPNEHSREQLFAWLKNRDFTITGEGWIVGYKGVRTVGDQLTSINQGKAIVDGVEYSGAIPNEIGSVVEMPRSEVAFDPGVGCSTGLHVGTYEYASGFAQGALLEVHVNPRDVVSVPTDSDAQKMRVCRYVVVDVIDAPHSSPVVSSPFEYDESDDEFYWGDGEGDEDDERFEEDDLVGVTFADNDVRRLGRTLTVKFVNGPDVTCVSSTTGKDTVVSLDRLLSNRYTRL
jgi:hypothetical protein